MKEARIALIQTIAKDALELEREEFYRDRTAYFHSQEIDISKELLEDAVMIKEVNITNKAINILTKRLCQLTADLSDEDAVEFISDSLRSKKIIQEVFKLLF